MTHENDHNQPEQTHQPNTDQLGRVMRYYIEALLHKQYPDVLTRRDQALQKKLAEGQTIGEVYNKKVPLMLISDVARFLHVDPKITMEYATALEPIISSEKRAVVNYYYIGIHHVKPAWYIDPATHVVWAPKKSYASLIHTEPQELHDREEAHMWYADIEEKLASDSLRREYDTFPTRPIPVGNAEDDTSPEAKTTIRNLLNAIAQTTGTQDVLEHLNHLIFHTEPNPTQE